MRTTQLANENPDRLAHRRRDEVELTGLGRRQKMPVLTCPQIAGFEPSTEALRAFRADWFSRRDRKSTRLNSSHTVISYAVFCLKKKTTTPSGRRTSASSMGSSTNWRQ